MQTTVQSESPVILSVTPLKEKRLRIVFGTGSELILNMKNRLNTVRFFPLRDDTVFDSVKTDGFCLYFDAKFNCTLNFTLREALRMAATNPGETIPGR